MKKTLAMVIVMLSLIAASAQPILRQFGTTNTPTVLTNIIVSLAGGSSQTPWLQAINGNGFDLLSVADQTNTGTIQAAGFVGDGSGLTNLNGTEIRSGTVADARIASTIARDSEVVDATNGLATALGTAAFSNSVSFLRAGVSVLDGSGVTNLNGSEIRSGTVPTARLGSGTANSTTFLRGDQTWATPAGGSQTPWTSDIDGATKMATNIGRLLVQTNGSMVNITNGTLQISNNLASTAGMIDGSNVFQIDNVNSKKDFQVDSNGVVFIKSNVVVSANTHIAGTNNVGGGIWVSNKPIVVLGNADSQQIVLSPSGSGSFSDGAVTISDGVTVGTSHFINADGTASFASGNILFGGGGGQTNTDTIEAAGFVSTGAGPGYVSLLDNTETNWWKLQANPNMATNILWVGPTNPGTGLIYGTNLATGNGTNVQLQQIANGTDGQVLTMTSGKPAFAAPGAGWIREIITGASVTSLGNTSSRFWVPDATYAASFNSSVTNQIGVAVSSGYMSNLTVYSTHSWGAGTNIVFTLQTNDLSGGASSIALPVNTPLTATLSGTFGANYTNSGTTSWVVPSLSPGQELGWTMKTVLTVTSGSITNQTIGWKMEWWHQ